MNESDEALLAQLQSLELELQRTTTRADRQRLDALLHADFVEFGRSGRAYAKADILALLLAESEPARIVADRFAIARLAADTALLTYRSAHREADGTLARHALRSSVWQRLPTGWQMRFHQGTPTAPSDD